MAVPADLADDSSPLFTPTRMGGQSADELFHHERGIVVDIGRGVAAAGLGASGVARENPDEELR